MTNATQTMDFLIRQITTIINNCKDSEQLLLATKASSTLLKTDPIAKQWGVIKENTIELNSYTTIDEKFYQIILETFNLFKAIIEESEVILDIMLISKGFKAIMENIADTIIFNDSDIADEQLVICENIAKEIIDKIVNRIKTLSDTIDDSEVAFFATNVLSSLDKTTKALSDVNLHFQSIKQLDTKVESITNEIKGDILVINNNISNLTNQLSQAITTINNLANNKNNTHEVTKTQLGLSNALIGSKTEDLNNSDTDKFHNAKATNQIYNLANEKIKDAPVDNKYYLRKDGQWVEGMGEYIPVGAIMPYSGKTAPTGWLMLESNTVHDRVLYPKLYEHLLNNCPHLIIDDDTFRLADSKGMFFRGYDPEGSIDPDGVGRELLTGQGDAIRNITGYVGDVYNSNNSNGVFYSNPTQSAFQGGSYSCPSTHFDASRVVPTSSENRPKNLNCTWIIKAFDTISDPAVIQSNAVIDQVSKNTVSLSSVNESIRQIHTYSSVIGKLVTSKEQPMSVLFQYSASETCVISFITPYVINKLEEVTFPWIDFIGKNITAIWAIIASPSNTPAANRVSTRWDGVNFYIKSWDTACQVSVSCYIGQTTP